MSFRTCKSMATPTSAGVDHRRGFPSVVRSNTDACEGRTNPRSTVPFQPAGALFQLMSHRPGAGAAQVGAASSSGARFRRESSREEGKRKDTPSMFMNWMRRATSGSGGDTSCALATPNPGPMPGHKDKSARQTKRSRIQTSYTQRTRRRRISENQSLRGNLAV